jgi:hypothetical protein
MTLGEASLPAAAHFDASEWVGRHAPPLDPPPVSLSDFDGARSKFGFRATSW